MSAEALWYQMYSPGGKAPHCSRLYRLPMAEQWQFAIDLAIEFAAGLAGYRSTWHSLTRECYWYRQRDGHVQWWLIPYRIDRRVAALVKAAIACEIRLGRGSCKQSAVIRRLEIWRRSAHWRRIAAQITPRHTAAKPRRLTAPQRRRAARIEELRAKLRPQVPESDLCELEEEEC